MNDTDVPSSIWGEKEKLALLSIWERHDILAQLDGTVRDGKVYNKLAVEMEKVGYIKTKAQIASKIKRWKQEYKTVQDNKRKTGRGRVTCDYYERLDAILGHRPSLNPTASAVFDSETKATDDNDKIPPSESPSASVEVPSTSDTTSTNSTAGNETEDEDAENESLETPVIEKAPTGTNVPSKRKNVECTNKGKKAKLTPGFIQDMFSQFLEYQKASEERFMAMEERRRLREEEQAAEMRAADKQHEMQLFYLLTQQNHAQVSHNFEQPQPEFSFYPTYTQL